MVALSALANDPQFDELPDASLHARNARTYFVGNVLVGRKTKTLLVGMCCQAIINCDANWLESLAVLVKEYFVDPIPIAIS